MFKFKFIKDHEYFLKIRPKTIGASDIPILLGLSKFTTPYELWRSKTGRQDPFEGNTATEWGNLHEGNILYRYISENSGEDIAHQFLLDYIYHKNSRATNYKPPTNYFPYTEFAHPDYKWAIAHPDLIDFDKKINVEAKSGRRFASLKRSGMDGFEKDDPQGIPLKYYTQIQWQMLCTGLNETVLRALIDTNEELEYKIQANARVQEKLLLAADKFMRDVKKDYPPMPTNGNDIKNMFPELHDSTAYLVGAESEYAIKMKERKSFLSEKVKYYKDEIADIDDALFLLTGGNKYLYSESGEKICTQVQFKSEKNIGPKKIKEYNENIYNELKENGVINETETRYIK